MLAGLAMLGTAALVTDRPDAAGPVDRLDQFRTLGRARSLGHGAPDGSPDAYREMYALLDEEIVESLGAGGVRTVGHEDGGAQHRESGEQFPRPATS